EAQFILQQIGEEFLATGAFLAIPAVVRRHDGPDAHLDRGDVAGQMHSAEGCFIYSGVALIERISFVSTFRRASSEARSAVADEMLRTRKDGEGMIQRFALKSTDRCSTELFHNVWRLAESFISTAPTDILRHCDTRREDPVDSGRAN